MVFASFLPVYFSKSISQNLYLFKKTVTCLLERLNISLEREVMSQSQNSDNKAKEFVKKAYETIYQNFTAINF